MSQENIFREVDEELRSDRMRALWKRFAPLVIGAAIGVVVLVAVNEGWNWYQSSNAAQSSDKLYAAFDAADGGDSAKAESILDDLVANGSGGYPTLARFRDAGLLAKNGKSTEAIAAYDALANNETSPRMRELALVLAANLLVDQGSLADVEARVSTLAAESGPMRNAAREALGLAQYKAGDFAAARDSFQSVIDDPRSQSSVRNRMSYYIAQLLSEGAIAPDAPTENAADATDVQPDSSVNDVSPQVPAEPAPTE
ncbi:tetratricopeptide repeat protein [Devosia algicola]|uniref:Tetratricopeptide repeat protein n=1 Tax=Devosia algicola TaxID=3026418 RepID=A0ABY7YQM8_9HYPH|nr:tetratricopeptide repeat protein [Devosia algicola]WDR03596.1 tetratricopeptide repeat protein [Devosia algicola]